jgi:hypothetical protein
MPGTILDSDTIESGSLCTFFVFGLWFTFEGTFEESIIVPNRGKLRDGHFGLYP